MLLGLISVTEGEIDFQGKPRDISNGKKKKEYWKGIQAIFQDPFAALNPLMRIGDQIKENLDFHTTMSEEEKHARVI